MAGERQLANVIGEVYEAAVDPAGLDGLAGIVARAFASDSGALALVEPSPTGGMPSVVGLPSCTANHDAPARTAYAEHYHRCNIWYERGYRLGVPTIVLCQELVDERTLLRSEWYDYCRRMNVFHCIGAQFRVSQGRLGMFGVHRPRNARAFDESDRRTMARLLPHLQRAIQVQQQLAGVFDRAGLGLEIVDHLGIGVIVVAADCSVLFANRIAEGVLHDGGAAITVRERRLQPRDGRRGPAFSRLILEAARTSEGRGSEAGGTFTAPAPSGDSLLLLVAPLRARRLAFGPEAPAAIVIFSDPARSSAPAERAVARACRLTPAETRVLAALLAGRTVADHAQAAGISVGTARIHLGHVLGKTGFHRQIDLVRAMASDSMALVRLGGA